VAADALGLAGEPRAHGLDGRLSVRRLLRLWRVYAYLDLLFMTKDVRRSATYWLSDVAVAVAVVTGAMLIPERFGGIGAWSKHQIGFMLGFGLLVHGLLDVFFGYNVKFISRRVGRGQLDHTLLQPHSVLTTILSEGFVPFSGLCALVPGGALLLWSSTRMGLQPTPEWLLLFVVQAIAVATITISFHFIWGTAAFWAPRGAEEISSSTNGLLDQLRQFPLDGLGPVAQTGLMTVLPIGFLAWYPCRALLGMESSPVAFALTPLAGLAFLLVATFAFRKGLGHYARTGSARYSDFGHRR
jgi:ABC-2 type transport system permease protein